MTPQAYAEKRFSVYLACYVYGYNYHDGQSSRAYKLLCCVQRKGFLPGFTSDSEMELRDTDPEATELLDRLIDRRY